MPVANTSIFQMLTHLILITIQWAKSYYQVHSMDEEIEAQRG